MSCFDASARWKRSADGETWDATTEMSSSGRLVRGKVAIFAVMAGILASGSVDALSLSVAG